MQSRTFSILFFNATEQHARFLDCANRPGLDTAVLTLTDADIIS
jgi:hypothetical protein